MAIKILVTGDVHIGKHSSAVPGNELKASAKYTWERIVQYIVNQHIDMLVLTGDIVDCDNKYYEAIGPLQAGFQTLAAAGIPVYMVAGNHDYDVLSQITSTAHSEYLHLLGRTGEWESAYFTKGEESIRLIGWSFTNRYIHREATDTLPADINEDNTPTLALLHGDAYAIVSKYNPIAVEKLRNTPGIDAWLLGHIHRPDVISPAHPLILYPGSPHALNPKEQGIHGPYLLTVEGRNISYHQLPLSPVYYDGLTIDISGVNDESDFRTRIVEALNTAVETILQTYTPDYIVYDVLLTGEYNNLPQLRKWGEALTNIDAIHRNSVSVRTVEYRINPMLDIEHLVNDPSYIGVLATAIRELEAGRSNSFTDKLLNEWKNRYRQIVQAGPYQPLAINTPGEEQDELARHYVLAECKALISELNNQRHEN